jgi:cytochrome c553
VRKPALMTLLVLAIAMVSLNAQAGSPARGQELAAAVCASCHGMDGNLVLADDYPKLGGQHADYLVFALKAYRSGDRDNDLMAPFARDLSDQDIRDLAAWFSRQEGLKDLRIR